MNIKEKPSIPRQFAISEKTPWTEFRNVNNWNKGHPMRNVVAKDLVMNAKELVPDLSDEAWTFILDQLTYYRVPDHSTLKGQKAISHTIAASVGTVCSHMKWDMHSPEIVYMSGYYLLDSLSPLLDPITERLSRSRSRRFTDDESGIKTIKHEAKQLGLLFYCTKEMKEALDHYTEKFLPQGEKYLTILQVLLYWNQSKQSTNQYKKNAIYDLLKEGNIEEAFPLVQTVIRRRPKNNDRWL